MNLVITQEEYELLQRSRDKALEVAGRYEKLVGEYKKITDGLLKSNEELITSLSRAINTIEEMQRAEGELHKGLKGILESRSSVESGQKN